MRDGTDPDVPTVLALVTTHSAPAHLRRCVDAVKAQEGAIVDVLVVDVAGAPPATSSLTGVEGVEHLRLDENVGPAGGWHAGLERFLETGHDVAWLLDDDCVAEPGALAELLRTATGSSSPGLVWPMIVDEAGRPYRGRGWCGPLVTRRAVQAVGLPRREFVYWLEDSEWFGRIGAEPRGEGRSSGAVVRVAVARPGTARPGWKYYYVIRNTVWARTRAIHDAVGGAGPRGRGRDTWFHLRRLVVTTARLFGRIVLIDRTQVIRKVRLAVMAVAHGATGRLGLTVPLDDPDRPA